MSSPEISSLLKTVEALPGISIRRTPVLMPIIVNTMSLSRPKREIATINLDDEEDDDDVVIVAPPEDRFKNQTAFNAQSGQRPDEIPIPDLPVDILERSEKENETPKSPGAKRRRIVPNVVREPDREELPSRRPAVPEEKRKILSENVRCSQTHETKDAAEKRSEETFIGANQSSRLFGDLIDVCLKLDASEEMKKIVDKKLKRYYESAHSQYTESLEFCMLVEQKTRDITNKPDHLFIHIRDIVNELDARRPKIRKKNNPDETDDDVNIQNMTDKDIKESNITEQKIRKIERSMKIINAIIKTFEEQEIDDTNEQDYIVEHKYKARIARLHKKLCQLKGERGINSNKIALHVISKISLYDDRLPHLKTELKKLALSKKHWFPDFPDILECVKLAASKSEIPFKSFEIQSLARDIFIEVGAELQKRRKVVEYQSLCDLMNSSTTSIPDDPAETDPLLEATLRENHKIGKRREREILDEFSKKQYSSEYQENCAKVELNESDVKHKMNTNELAIDNTLNTKEMELIVENSEEKNNEFILIDNELYDSDIELIL